MTVALVEKVGLPPSKEAAHALVEHGSVLIRAAFGNEIAGVVRAWERFCLQDEAAKMRLAVRPITEDEFDEGYFEKRGQPAVGATDGYWDDKEYFHYRPVLQPELRRKLNAQMSAVEDALLCACARLYWVSLFRMQEVLEELDGVLPNYGFCQRTKNQKSMRHHVLRLLRYRPVRQAGQLLGKPHIDRNGFTFHVWDSRPGLYLHESKEGAGELFEVQPNTVLAFPGKQTEAITGGNLKGQWHSISSPVEFGVNLPSRVSIVFFTHLRD